MRGGIPAATLTERYALVRTAAFAADLALTAIVVFAIGFGTYYRWRQEHPWLLAVTIRLTSLILSRSTWRGGGRGVPETAAGPRPGPRRASRRR